MVSSALCQMPVMRLLVVHSLRLQKAYTELLFTMRNVPISSNYFLETYLEEVLEAKSQPELHDIRVPQGR